METDLKLLKLNQNITNFRNIKEIVTKMSDNEKYLSEKESVYPIKICSDLEVCIHHNIIKDALIKELRLLANEISVELNIITREISEPILTINEEADELSYSGSCEK